MKRREFIVGLGGAAAWSMAARAQRTAIPIVGVLYQSTTDYAEAFLGPIREGFRELGYVDGQNIVIEYLRARRAEQLSGLAAQLVSRKVDVIVASGSQAVSAAREATRSIPIVMASSSDPVAMGFVTSLARPGGNITGMSLASPDISGKRLELLREIVGSLSAVAVLWDQSDPVTALSFKETKSAASALGISVNSIEVRGHDDFDGAFAAALKERPKALIILAAPIMSINAERIAVWALKNGVPALSYDRQFPAAGGLMSYGASLVASRRRALLYVDKILKGAKPADLPVEQPTTFELIINLKTAKTLALTVPQSLQVAADELIE